jgi:peroxiredoxin-like protein
MADADIPSGGQVRDSQADGSGESPRREPIPQETEHEYHASAVWTGDAAGAGKVRLGEAGVSAAIAGARELGGSGSGTNPEELLVGALAACFVNTWAIFLKKLQIPYAEPAIRVTGTLGKDPAGGFHMTGAVIRARVPESLLAADRPKVEKTLSLTEKYCIISKVVRAAMPVRVEIETV